MSHQPERALTQSSRSQLLHLFISVEMSHQPERALTPNGCINTSLNCSVSRNESSAREGIDTLLAACASLHRSRSCRNESSAREGIDTVIYISFLPLGRMCRNESSAREGIDTTSPPLPTSRSLYQVEMSHQPERALTPLALRVEKLPELHVEMSHQPERALTQLHSFRQQMLKAVEMSHQPERALTHF